MSCSNQETSVFTHVGAVLRMALVLVACFLEGATNVPFGFVDTPTDNTTGAKGAINVTGWALSPSVVTKVELWRAAVAPETGGTLIYLTDAQLIPGARPDVANAYPGYPNNDFGWGAQILTNEPPGTSGGALGNGTYRVHVIVKDGGGNSQDIGSRGFRTDNLHSIVPFGTIDTPAQGSIASGNAFVNFGWGGHAPGGNVIPKDGSTITVFIDNVPVGHPVYNNNRSDIATLFPGLQNSNGAVGYYIVDTTKLTDGLHQLAWSVQDSAGNLAGLGSRFLPGPESGVGYYSFTPKSGPAGTLVTVTCAPT